MVFFIQLAAKVTQNVNWHKHVWIVNVLIPASLKNVVSMHNAQPRITVQFVHAFLTTNQIQILTYDANNMNACLILTVLAHLPVSMKNVLIHVSVLDLLIVQWEITRGFAPVFLAMKAIHMVSHAPLVSSNSLVIFIDYKLLNLQVRVSFITLFQFLNQCKMKDVKRTKIVQAKKFA